MVWAETMDRFAMDAWAVDAFAMYALALAAMGVFIIPICAIMWGGYEVFESGAADPYINAGCVGFTPFLL